MARRPAPVPFAPRAEAFAAQLLDVLVATELPHGYSARSCDLQQGLALRLDGPDGPLHLELDLAGPEVSGYDRAGPFRISHARRRGGALTAPQRETLEVAIDALRPLLKGWQPPSPAPREHQRPIRQVLGGPVLGEAPNLPTDLHINPYIGCTVGCVYCNAQFRGDDVRALDGRPRRAWGTWLDARVDAPQTLARELRERAAAGLGPASVCFSPVITDPYVPLERKLGITRGCLELLRDAGYTAVVLTRTDGVLRDLDVLGAMAGAAVGVSVPTEDPALLARLEPRAMGWQRRLEVLDAVRAAGVRAFAVVQPAFPADIDAFVDAIAPRVEAVRVDGAHETARLGEHFRALGAAPSAELKAAFEARGVATDLRALFAALRPR